MITKSGLFRRFSAERAFTLVEILIVISIIAILSSVVFASVRKARIRARDARRLSDIGQIVIALNLYASDHDGYPSTLENGDWWHCLGMRSDQSCWRGEYSGLDSVNAKLAPYISPIPLDPRNDASCNGEAYAYGTFSNMARLHWYYENTDVSTSKACGSGTYGGSNECGPYCYLFLGPPVEP